MTLVRLFVLLVGAVLAVVPARAEARRVTEGTLLWRTAQQETAVPAPLLATDVEMHVTGLIVRATVRQRFTNRPSSSSTRASASAASSSRSARWSLACFCRSSMSNR